MTHSDSPKDIVWLTTFVGLRAGPLLGIQPLKWYPCQANCCCLDCPLFIAAWGLLHCCFWLSFSWLWVVLAERLRRQFSLNIFKVHLYDIDLFLVAHLIVIGFAQDVTSIRGCEFSWYNTLGFTLLYQSWHLSRKYPLIPGLVRIYGWFVHDTERMVSCKMGKE